MFYETGRRLDSMHIWRIQPGQAERNHFPKNEKERGKLGINARQVS